MCSPSLQGTFLAFLASYGRAERILDLGTFTGYSALTFAGVDGVREVVTVDSDCNAVNVAGTNVSKSPFGHKISLRHAQARDALRELSTDDDALPFDLVFLDCDKRAYVEYYDMLMDSGLVTEGSLILADNVLWKDIMALSESGERDGGADDETIARWMRPGAGLDDDGLLSKRYKLLARAMDDYNTYVSQDERTEQVVLPLQDGLSLARVR